GGAAVPRPGGVGEDRGRGRHDRAADGARRAAGRRRAGRRLRLASPMIVRRATLPYPPRGRPPGPPHSSGATLAAPPQLPVSAAPASPVPGAGRRTGGASVYQKAEQPIAAWSPPPGTAQGGTRC